MNYTQGDPALIAKARSECLHFNGMAGRGATAPGAVVVKEVGGYHPFAAYFFNSQDGGYHFGDYCETEAEAIVCAARKAAAYDRFGELRAAFRSDGQ